MANLDSEFMAYSPELENFEFEDSEWAGESAILSEADLHELALELIGVNSEAELDQFLGNLIKKAGRSLGKIVKSPIGRAVGGFLKGVAKKALPLAGTVVGGYFGGPLGAKIGKGLASAASNVLGLEAEALNAEDQEFEGAKHFCRLGAEAVRQALAAPAGSNPTTVAQQAVKAAAGGLAPGLLSSAATAAPMAVRSSGSSGRWVRRGRSIVIYNV